MRITTLFFLALTLTANAAQYLKAPVIDPNDGFGSAVAMHGTTLVVGAPKEDGDTVMSDNPLTDSGAAYVYVRENGQWVFEAYLKASDRDFEAGFGSSVAISGDSIVVGSPQRGLASDGSFFVDPAGAAYVFTRQDGVWTQQQKLLGNNTGDSDNFGTSVAIDGNTAVIGARFEAGTNNTSADSGAAYVFSRTGSIWTQDAYLRASNAGALDEFGTAVAVSGNRIAVGAPFEDDGGPEAGAVYIFGNSAHGWTEQQILRASDAAAGDFFGTSLAMDGDRLVIGARGEDDMGNGSGAAYVFAGNETAWQQETRLKAASPSATAEFGTSVALSAERVACGAPGEDSGGNGAGGVWTFHRSTSGWGTGTRVPATNEGPGDGFGGAVAISGLELSAGAQGEDGTGNTASNSGAVYAFTLSPKSYSEWIADQGFSGNDALETAIPKNDGVPNLLAYALGLPVGSGGRGRLPEPTPDGSSFLRPATPPADITFTWQESDDLSAWDDLASRASGATWTGNFAANVTEDLSADGFVEVNVTHSRSAPELFLRLKVTRN